jgi:hypothetical protein
MSDHDRMLEKLRELGPISPPHVTVAEDGAVDFYWKTDLLLIDLGTDGNGEFSWFARFPDGTESLGELGMDQPLPEKIVEAIRAS